MKFENLLETKNNLILSDLLRRCNDIKSIDQVKLKQLAIESAKASKSGMTLPEDLDIIFRRWYASLSEKPDYSVYGEDNYIAELWSCWSIYSRKHLQNIQKNKSLFEEPKVIVDLGCGFGYTTAALRQIFPNAKIYGTNLENTLQMDVARTLASDYGFHLVSNVNQIEEKVDLVFASEYFEHFEEPIDHLQYIIKTIHPKMMCIANAFGPKAIGHFDKYRYYLNDIVEYLVLTAKSMEKFLIKN